MSGRPKIFGHLMAEVIRKDLCVGCGGCVAVCPVYSVEMDEGQPKLVGLCVACGMCYNICPRVEFDVEGLEKEVFGRIRNESELDVGVIHACYAVRANEQKTLDRCQDGGAVTAILSQFLDEGGDSAIVAGLSEEVVWAPHPVVALTKEDVVSAAGTKYTPSPTLVGVDSAINEYGKNKIAVVGTPCQMTALRRIETGDYSEAKIKDSVDLSVGLFCMETFSYISMMEFLENVGVDASKVTKFDIKKGRFIAWEGSNAVYDVKLSEVKKLVRPCCHACSDFSAEFSDLAVGNVGSPEGWSTVLVRTEKGEAAVRAAENSGAIEVKALEDVKPGLKSVVNLSRLKKKQSKKEE